MISPDSGSYLPLVSILIPCYNAEAWVEECIESALAQTYTNKEIIVVDDGSTDASAAIIERYADRVTLRRAANAGANVARNLLTQLARGDWLQYLDADDYLLPQKIASQVELLAAKSGELDVIYSPMIVRHDAAPEKDYTTTIPDDDETLNFIRWVPFNSHGMLLRRQAVLDSGGWKVDQPCCQEHELVLRLLLAKSRFAVHQIPGAVYRKHGSGTISSRDPMRVIRLRMSLTDLYEQHLRASGNLTSSHRSALFVARMEAARSAFRWDPGTAEELSVKACGTGSRWLGSSPALPWTYRMALGLVGFRKTELAARKMRFLEQNA